MLKIEYKNNDKTFYFNIDNVYMTEYYINNE